MDFQTLYNLPFNQKRDYGMGKMTTSAISRSGKTLSGKSSFMVYA